MEQAKVDFRDMDDLGATAPVASKTHEQMMEAAAPRYGVNQAHRAPAADAEAGTHRETCRKCGGTGSFRGWSGRSLGSCFACDGKGFKLFKTSAADRAAKRERAVERKVEAASQNVTGFAAANPAISAWLVSASERGFGFAVSLREAVAKYGHLTDGQKAAVEKCMVKDAERAAARAQQAAAAPAVGEGVAPLKAALEKAKASGLKRVKLSTSKFDFSLAKDSGKNPGCIYVKAADGAYLGKITPAGALQTSYEGRAREAEIVEVCKDPLAAAKLYGQETGRCSCCGRELTDPASIAASIGPVCAERFGW